MPILTRSSTSTVAEAPRPACDQWDGRSPGSRVIATCRLPDLSLADRHQWLRASARRLQLRGQPWVCIGALGRSTRTTFPHRSFARKRPSRALVQRCAGALSMDRPGGDYCRRRGDALRWRRCQVLVQAWGWRVKREAGASSAQSRRCPRNGMRIKANTEVTAPAKGVWEDIRRP
jgi:hypothetical protein